MQKSEKKQARGEIAKRQKIMGREEGRLGERACKPHPPITLPTSWKTVSRVNMSKAGEGFICLTCLLDSIHPWPNDWRKSQSKLSQMTNHRVYQESVYRLLEWDIENNTYGVHPSISPQPSRSSCATFVDPLSPLSSSSPFIPIRTSTQVAMVGWCMNMSNFKELMKIV